MDRNVLAIDLEPRPKSVRQRSDALLFSADHDAPKWLAAAPLGAKARNSAEVPYFCMWNILAAFRSALIDARNCEQEAYADIRVPIENNVRRRAMREAIHPPVRKTLDVDGAIELAAAYRHKFERNATRMQSLAESACHAIQQEVQEDLACMRNAYLTSLVDTMMQRGVRAKGRRITLGALQDVVTLFTWPLSEMDEKPALLLFMLPGTARVSAKGLLKKARPWVYKLLELITKFEPDAWALSHNFTRVALMDSWWTLFGNIVINVCSNPFLTGWGRWERMIRHIFTPPMRDLNKWIRILDSRGFPCDSDFESFKAWRFFSQIFNSSDTELYTWACKRYEFRHIIETVTKVFIACGAIFPRSDPGGEGLRNGALLYYRPEMQRLILHRVGFKPPIKPPSRDRVLVQATAAGKQGAELDAHMKGDQLVAERKLYTNLVLWQKVRDLVKVRAYAWAWYEVMQKRRSHAEMADDGTPLLIGGDAIQLQTEYAQSVGLQMPTSFDATRNDVEEERSAARARARELKLMEIARDLGNAGGAT